MDPAFRVHMLDDAGKVKARELAEAFDELLHRVKLYVPEGRELALVKTKLEEACFFAKKGMANVNAVPA